MRRLAPLLLVCVAFLVNCGDSPTEPVPPRNGVLTDGAVAGGGVALATASTEDGLTITTDKDDYQPGDTVQLTGSGWPAGDTLDILLEDEPRTHEPHRWWIVAGEDGTFQDSTYVVDQGDLDVTFTLTATSRASGRALSVVFTDGNPQSVSLSPTSQTVGATGSAAYTIAVTMGGNTNPCTVTLSASGLPSGATASIPDNVVNASNVDFSRTLTITTNNAQPGSYQFTVLAARGSNCQGNGDLTVNGTLVVLGPAAQLAFGHQPGDRQSATVLSPAVTVRVEDSGGNLVATSSASVTIALGNNPGSGTLSGTFSQSAVNGVATFPSLAIDKVGTGYTLVATSTGLSQATSNAFNITLGPGTKLAFTTQPSGGAPNTAFATQPVVQVHDAGGNRVTSGTGSNASIALAIVSPPAGAALTCTTNPLAASTGQSAFAGCRINQAGTGYRLRATTSGLASADSDPFSIAVVNQPPTVDAGSYTLNEGTALELAPTVNDPDGNPLTYKWAVNTAGIDNGGACTFDDDTKKNATITCTDDSKDAAGAKFTLTLTVSDGIAPAVGDNADLTVANAAPSADAGGAYSGNEGAAIQLAGSGDDPGNNDDSQLGYQWTVVTTGIDAGGACTFDNASSKNAKITCTDDGSFKVRLVASDDDGGTSAASEAELTVGNEGPVANAGGPYQGNEGSPVQLNGTVTDAGANDTHTWLWKYVDGAGIDGGTCSFDDADLQDPKITCTDDGTVQLTLKVTDDDGAASVAQATLTLANADPVADAGGAYTGKEGSPVNLNGSVADAGANDTHAWSWQYVGTNVDPGAACSISNAALEDPTITCTDDGTVRLTLTVTDDDGGSDSDEATLTLSNVNPVAGAGATYSGAEGGAIALTGTATDAGTNDVLSNQWAFTPVSGVDAGAGCSFTPNASALSPSVSCTDDGTYKVTLTVTDDDGGSHAAHATLTLTNADPVASAGGPYTVPEGGVVKLNGSVTDAGQNDTHVWSWQYVAGQDVDAGATCTISTPSAEDPNISCTDDGTVKLTLTVNDDDGGSDADEATLTVTNVNPVASAGGPYSGDEGQGISLTGMLSDAGANDTHTQQWSYAPLSGVDAGATCAFGSNGTVLKPTVTCTDDGTYLLTLTVTDDDGGVGTSSVNLALANVRPEITALTKADGTPLPLTLIVAGTLNLRGVFTDRGSNDDHVAAVQCEDGAPYMPAGGASPFTAGCTFTSIGLKTISARVTDDDGESHVVSHTLTIKYNFDGFYAPVDRPNTMNMSKAGQSIPLKWRLTDVNGRGIVGVTGVTVQSQGISCTLSNNTDVLEEYAAGGSGLQDLGDGYYQFNWKTPSSYVNTCKSVALVFASGGIGYTEKPSAYFTFKK